MTTIYKTRGGNKIFLLSLPHKASKVLEVIRDSAIALNLPYKANEGQIEVFFADCTTATYTAEENDYICDEETNDERQTD